MANVAAIHGAAIHPGSLEANLGQKPTLPYQVSGVTAGDIAAAEGRLGQLTPEQEAKIKRSAGKKIEAASGKKAKAGESFPGESALKSIGENPLEDLLVPGKFLGSASEAAHNALGVPTVGEFGEKAAEGVVGLVKPIATKLTLYAVLIFGAVAFIVYGVSKMLEPVGGPNLKHEIGRAAGLGGRAAFLGGVAAA